MDQNPFLPYLGDEHQQNKLWTEGEPGFGS